MRFLKFLKKREKDKKYEETDLMRKLIKKRGNHSTLNIGKWIRNIRKSLHNSELLRDLLEFLKKRKFLKYNFCSVSVLSCFRVEAFPCHLRTHRHPHFNMCLMGWVQIRHCTPLATGLIKGTGNNMDNNHFSTLLKINILCVEFLNCFTIKCLTNLTEYCILKYHKVG